MKLDKNTQSLISSLIVAEENARKHQQVEAKAQTQHEKTQRAEIKREAAINAALQKCKDIRKRIAELEKKYLTDRRSLQLELEAAENERDRAISVKV